MVKENITLIQLFTLIFNLLLGSTIITGIGKASGQDIWLVILVASIVGIGFMYGFYLINQLHPGKNLFEIMEYCFNRKFAVFLSITFCVYFFYMICRMARTFTAMISSVILPLTPTSIITLTLFLVIAYMIYLGLEVISRVSEVFTPYIIAFFLLLVIFLIGSGEIEVNHFQPIMGDGFQPILKTLPSVIVFPFGELLMFTVILSNVIPFQKGKKISLISVGFASLLLTVVSLLMLLTLGEEMLKNAQFPLLTTTRAVSIGEFIERIEVFAVFIMTLTLIIKACLYFYGGVKGLEYIFRIPYRNFSVPFSILLSVFTNFIALDYAEHMEEGDKFANYFHYPMQLGIPIILLIILLWKDNKSVLKG